MPEHPAYRTQVELLLRCLPAVAGSANFALKGGTALNLFVHDMPRLSVDIDLTYLPFNSYDEAVPQIRSELFALASKLERQIPGASVEPTAGPTPKLLVRTAVASIKIEPNVVVRGNLLPTVESELCPAASRDFELFLRVRRLASAELYAGKLCAALDRQHPRDFFDVKLMLRSGAIPDETRQAFVAYVAGHRRPMAEILAPRPQPLAAAFENQFVGMAADRVTLAELEAAREHLFAWVVEALTAAERHFLLSVKRGEPDWGLLPFPDLPRWPAIQWKLQNIRQMDATGQAAATERLQNVLKL
jgi:hypothetical protein